MSPVWDEVKKSVKELGGAATDKADEVKKSVKELGWAAADKAEELTRTAAKKAGELTRVGRLKLDMLSINRDIDKHFQELGKSTYGFMSGGKSGSVLRDAGAKTLVKEIDSLQSKLNEKKNELEALKSEGETDEAAVETEEASEE